MNRCIRVVDRARQIWRYEDRRRRLGGRPHSARCQRRNGQSRQPSAAPLGKQQVEGGYLARLAGYAKVEVVRVPGIEETPTQARAGCVVEHRSSGPRLSPPRGSFYEARSPFQPRPLGTPTHHRPTGRSQAAFALSVVRTTARSPTWPPQVLAHKGLGAPFVHHEPHGLSSELGGELAGGTRRRHSQVLLDA